MTKKEAVFLLVCFLMEKPETNLALKLKKLVATCEK